MNKNIVVIIALFSYTLHADHTSWRHHHGIQPAWRHNGIYIVNKSDGYLTVKWGKNNTLSIAPAPLAPTHRKQQISKALIPVDPNTTINVFYHDTVQDHADMPSCRGGAQLSFTTNDRMVLYEIFGGYDEGKGPFNRPGTGPRCHIKMHHQSLIPSEALKKYPDLK